MIGCLGGSDGWVLGYLDHDLAVECMRTLFSIEYTLV
jgi:hypothetical protein